MVESRGTLAGALCVGLLPAGQAAAQPEAPFREFAVQYRAPATCPDRASFVAAIQARAERRTALVDGPAALRFRVELHDDGPSTLWVETAEGASQRELTAPSCSEALASMAVIAAMVLDTAAGQAPATAEAPLELDDSVAAPPPLLPVPSPARPPEAAPTTEPLVPSDYGASADPRATRGMRLALVAGATWESAVAPAAPLGGTVGLELRSRRRSWWAPRLRAELVATAASTQTIPDGDATFRLLAGRLSACPVQLGLARSARLLPCLTFDAGALTAEGGGRATNVVDRRMPWLAAGVTARLEIELSRFASLEASAALRRLARHDRFVFRPASLAYEVPGWSAGVGAGLALHFD